MSVFRMAAVALAVLLSVPGVTAGADGAYRIVKPEGAGPFPVVPAERLRATGHAVVYVDYLAARGLKTCSDSIALFPGTDAVRELHGEATRDVMDAVAWLRTQPFVDPARIAAVGWAFGGSISLAALMHNTSDGSGLSRVIAYYPVCRLVQPWKVPTPVLMLLGGAEPIARRRACEDLAQRSAKPDAVKIVVYEGAVQAFDVAGLPERTSGPFGTIGYHPQAAAAARQEVERFLWP
jgi:dienelactone hydrolase